MKKHVLWFVFLWYFAVIVSAVTAQNTQLSGTMAGPSGTPFNGFLKLSLEQQGAAISTCSSYGAPVQVLPNETVSITVQNGAMINPPKVWGADCLSPSNIPYNITVQDIYGNTLYTDEWLIMGTMFDIGTAVSVYNPNISYTPFPQSCGNPIGTTCGGTGAATAAGGLSNLLSGSTIPIGNGGTGATTATGALANLGGISSTQTALQMMEGSLSVPTLPLTVHAEGDSLTYGFEGSYNVGSWTVSLSELIPIPVYNSAVGGFSSSQVCALDGACPTYTTASVTIPACASLPCGSGVAVTYTPGYEPLSNALPYTSVVGNQPNGINETLDGIAGNVVWNGTSYFFTPTQICSSTVVPSGTQHIMAQPYYNAIKLIDVGRNDGYNWTLTEANIASIAVNRPADQFYGVMPVINTEEPSENAGQSGYVQLAALSSYLATTYGNNYVSFGGVDTRKVLANYACAATDPVSVGDCAHDQPSAYLRAINGEGTLQSSITSGQTSFVVAFPLQCCTSTLILIDGGTVNAELDQVTGIANCTSITNCATPTITVNRTPYEGTAVAHSANANVEFIDTTHLNATGYGLQAQIVAEWMGAQNELLSNTGALLAAGLNKGAYYTANSSATWAAPATYLQPGTQQRTVNNLTLPLAPWNFTEAFPVTGQFGAPPGTPNSLYSPQYPNAPAAKGLAPGDSCTGIWEANGSGALFNAGAICYNNAENGFQGQWNFYASPNYTFGSESWKLAKSISTSNETMPLSYTVPSGGTVNAPGTSSGHVDTLATTSQLTRSPAPVAVGTPACTATTGTTVSLSYAPTVGNTLVVSYYNAGGTLVTPTDNESSVYTLAGSAPNGAGVMGAYYVLNVAAGITSISVTQSYTYVALCVSEYSGGASIGTITSGTTGTGPSYSIPTTTQANNSYLIYALDGTSNTAFSASTGRIAAQSNWWSTNGRAAIQDISASTAGINSITGTQGNFVGYVGIELQSGLLAGTATRMSTNGTANQVWGMNSEATAQGWQTGNLPSQYKTWSCVDGLLGTTALATSEWAATGTCLNESGVSWTITGTTCYVDGGTGTTVAVTNGSGTSLLASTLTCSTSWATPIAPGSTTTIANGGFIKWTPTPDGTAKVITIEIYGTY